MNGTVACFEGAIYVVACMLLNVFMFGIGNAYVMQNFKVYFNSSMPWLLCVKLLIYVHNILYRCFEIE